MTTHAFEPSCRYLWEGTVFGVASMSPRTPAPQPDQGQRAEDALRPAP